MTPPCIRDNEETEAYPGDSGNQSCMTEEYPEYPKNL